MELSIGKKGHAVMDSTLQKGKLMYNMTERSYD